MTSSLRIAAVALCAALALTACSKHSDSTSTTDTSASAAPDSNSAASPGPAGTASGEAGSGASAAPAASATTGAMTPSSAAPTTASQTTTTTTTTTTTGGATNGTTGAAGNGTTTTTGGNGAANAFITLPVYPGAATAAAGDMSASTATGSFEVKHYTTKDDSKAVADWYKAHLPAAFQAMVLTTNGKTTATFADDHPDKGGDQSVMVTVDGNSGATVIQLATKKGN